MSRPCLLNSAVPCNGASDDHPCLCVPPEWDPVEWRGMTLEQRRDAYDNYLAETIRKFFTDAEFPAQVNSAAS